MKDLSAERYVVLLGAPGAGKGTQAGALAERLGVAHVASGDLFRQAVGAGTELGRSAQGYMERGELVPDGITIAMMMERLSQPDCVKGAILDGFPRTLGQALALDRAFADAGRRISQVLYIRVGEGELLRRLSGRWLCRRCQTSYHELSTPPQVPGRCDRCGGELYQRDDDRRETAERRLAVYFQQTLPLIDYYRQAGLLIEVDGEGSVEDVGQAILRGGNG
ncbi:MAG: adenylate kinase [Chloroflexi bacterium]|nr:adenylate kinase [Chloroflexota bacterium]